MPLAIHILFISFFSGTPASPYKLNEAFPAASIARVMVTNWRGDVLVQASHAPEVRVRSRVIFGGAHCQASARLEGDLLVVEAARSQECRSDVEVEAPVRVALESVTGAGDLRVRGTHGPVRVRTGSGDVHLEGVVTQLTASLGSGDLRATQLTGDATVRQGGGSSKLQCMGSGSLHLRVGAGDVEVLLPPSAVVGHQLTVGAGDIRMQALTGANPTWMVRGTVGAGRVLIRNQS